MSYRRHPFLKLISLCLIFLCGCQTLPYQYSRGTENPKTLPLRPGEAQIERGRPNRFLDGLGHYFISLPSKLILWNWNVENHKVSEETQKYIQDYLLANDLKNVKVRINQYAPGGEWRRLFKNHTVGWFWKIIFGIPTVFFYMILPERVFGGDNYNPYTNTISLYSDHPAIALHEGGHSKDFSKRKYKGCYSVLYMLPLFPLYTEAIATRDAVGYLKDKKEITKEKNAYKILYPAYTTYITGEFAGLVPIDFVLQIALVIPGHIAGRIKAHSIEQNNQQPQNT